MRSTAEWEAALEGTTPGPWEVTRSKLAVSQDVDDQRFLTDREGEFEADEDAELASLAPEAVAEVIRLRRELELRVRIWQKVAEKLENRGDKDGASQARHTVAVVTRILEGTHE